MIFGCAGVPPRGTPAPAPDHDGVPCRSAMKGHALVMNTLHFVSHILYGKWLNYCLWAGMWFE